MRMKLLRIGVFTLVLSCSIGAGELVEPTTLKQFDDNRIFVVNGRKCVGSELNGQRADDPDERRFTRGNRLGHIFRVVGEDRNSAHIGVDNYIGKLQLARIGCRQHDIGHARSNSFEMTEALYR